MAGVPGFARSNSFQPDAHCSIESDMRHLRIHRPQVSIFTPEEVYNFSFDTIDWGPPPRQAAVVNLGKSDWLNRFAQTHLVRCSHFRLMFYDQIIDLI